MRLTACLLCVGFLVGCLAIAVAADEPGANVVSGIPAELKGFQGMMSGKLVRKGDDRIVFRIERIMKTWKDSQAERPEQAVGKTLTLNLNHITPTHRAKMMKNYKAMETGDAIEVEAFDLGGKNLAVKEWLQKAGDERRDGESSGAKGGKVTEERTGGEPTGERAGADKAARRMKELEEEAGRLWKAHLAAKERGETQKAEELKQQSIKAEEQLHELRRKQKD